MGEGVVLTPEYLAEVRARCEAATPRPWLYDQAIRDLNVGGDHVQEVGELTVVGEDGDSEVACMFGVDEERSSYPVARYTKQAWANAAFIAHARDDLPAILAAAEQVPVLIAEVKAARTALSDAIGLLRDIEGLVQNGEGGEFEYRIATLASFDETIRGYEAALGGDAQ